MTLQELMTKRYGDRGGYRVLSDIFRGSLPYEEKLTEAGKTFRVSRGQVVRWYGVWREAEGLKR